MAPEQYGIPGVTIFFVLRQRTKDTTHACLVSHRMALLTQTCLAVYPSGLVCISILHPAGDDPNHYEHATERWSPIQSVEKILLSVMNLLAEPNDESPANVDAAKMWRDHRAEYDNKVKEGVRRSLGL